MDDSTGTSPGGTVAPASGTIDLDIGPVAHGGWCVAHHAGKVVFVRHTLPGERVRARVVEETARLIRAEAVEIIDASPDRVTPPCPYAGPGRCGGCDWQHASLPAQRRMKAAVVEEQLRRLAGIERDVVVEAVPTGPEPDRVDDGLGWRTRVQFAVRRDGVIGFRRHRSHEVEPVDRCLITHPEIERLGIEQHRWPGAERVEGAASATTGDRLVALTGWDRHRRVRVPHLAAPVRVVQGEPQPGPALPYVREHAAGRSWQVSGAGFWQVHPGAAQALTDAVVDGLRPHARESVLDLYCGVGLFLGALAASVGPTGTLVGVEENAVAILDARHNLRDLPHVTIRTGRVDRVLGKLGRVDLVVLDPPRTGAGRDVVAGIVALGARRVAYVSCDPATLARDIGYFAGHGWRLANLRAFDTFPMTHHIECVAILEPAGPQR